MSRNSGSRRVERGGPLARVPRSSLNTKPSIRSLSKGGEAWGVSSSLGAQLLRGKGEKPKT